MRCRPRRSRSFCTAKKFEMNNDLVIIKSCVYHLFSCPFECIFCSNKRKSRLIKRMTSNKHTSTDSDGIDCAYLYRWYNCVDVDIHRQGFCEHFVGKILYNHHMISLRNVFLKKQTISNIFKLTE
jgi:hypothetical protein